MCRLVGLGPALSDSCLGISKSSLEIASHPKADKKGLIWRRVLRRATSAAVAATAGNG